MSLAKTRFRQALFLHSISDIPTAPECYCPSGSDIVRLRLSVIFYSPFKLAQRIPLPQAISLPKAIELAEGE
jgi:hypothetical protein